MRTLELAWSRRLSGPLTSIRRLMARVNRAFYLGPAGYIWMGIVALAAVVAVIAIGTRWRRSLRMRATLQLQHVHGREHHRMLRQLGFYLDMLTVLEKSGFPKPDWQPPLEYAAVLAQERPEPAPLVAEITEIFYSARYGGAPLVRDAVLHAQSLVRQLAAVCGDPTGASLR